MTSVGTPKTPRVIAHSVLSRSCCLIAGWLMAADPSGIPSVRANSSITLGSRISRPSANMGACQWAACLTTPGLPGPTMTIFEPIIRGVGSVVRGVGNKMSIIGARHSVRPMDLFGLACGGAK
jgi:hypothetical protein